MTIEASPLTDAYSPDELRNEMLKCGPDSMLSVLPDSVLVWKMRSMPLVSCV